MRVLRAPCLCGKEKDFRLKKIIAVIGGRRVERSLLKEAEKVGRLIARKDIVLVCGGLTGVMEAVSKGAKAEGAPSAYCRRSIKERRMNTLMSRS